MCRYRTGYCRNQKRLYHFVVIHFFTTSDQIRTLHSQVNNPMSFYDEIELEDLTYHPSLLLYTYPCPCGDQFEICVSDMRDGEEVAICPSCSLTIRVIFDLVRH